MPMDLKLLSKLYLAIEGTVESFEHSRPTLQVTHSHRFKTEGIRTAWFR